MALAHSDALGEIGQVTHDPTGYVNNLNSTIANTSVITFDEATRTFSIAPTGVSFDYYIKGVKFTKSVINSVQISNTNGVHFLYFDGLTLVDDETPPIDYLLSGVAFTANVYWNVPQQKAIIFGEERHGLNMPWAVHNRLHYVDHSRFVSGFALDNFVVNGNGSLASHIQFACNAGIFKDEDIEHQISDGVVQDISPILTAPILYREGSANLWYITTPSIYPVRTAGTGRAAYNQLVSGTWQQTEDTNNDFMLMHVFATNDLRYPIMLVQGINKYTTQTAARNGAEIELTSLSGLPFVEFISVGTIIVQTSNTYTNAVKSRIVSTASGDNYVDFRDIKVTAGGAASEHGRLAGLLDYDHPQYAKSIVFGDDVFMSYARLTKEPTGFPNRTTSAISFNDLTHTFTITPTGASFDFYNKGIKFTKSVAESLIISDVEGIHFIYYNESGVLTELVNDDNHELLFTNAYVTAVRWNAVDKSRVYFGDERHEFMPWQTHVNKHEGHGTLYLSGLLLGNIIADGGGDLNSHATLSVADGIIRDEDITSIITNGAPQVLATVAQIPVFYRSGINGDWRHDTITDYPIKNGGTGRLMYNQFTGGVWQQTEVSNNDYMLIHLFATNDVDHHIVAIQGQSIYATQNLARTGATVEIKNIILTGLPEVEFVPIGSIIYQTSNTYTNAVKARIRTTDTGESYVNWLFYGGSKLLLLRSMG